MPDDVEIKRTSIYLPKDLYMKIGSEAKEHSLTDSAVMVKMIRKGFSLPEEPKEINKTYARGLSKEETRLAEALLGWWTTPSPSPIQKLLKQSLADILKLTNHLPKQDR